MNGIYYKDGIYVLIDNDIQNDICFYHYENKTNVSLYGGRVEITGEDYEWARIYIDGISIVKCVSKSIENRLNLFEIAAHLNAIEANGVDAFIQNYKESINFLYGELKELNQKAESQLSIEQEDSKIKNLLAELTKIRELLFSVLAILFSLYTCMSAGLENDKVISACQSVMDSLS